MMSGPTPETPDPPDLVERIPQCLSCRHLVRPAILCPAFPGSGIPPAILANTFDHREPFPGQTGPELYERRATSPPR